MSFFCAEQQRRLSSIKVQRLKELEKSYPGISSMSSWLESAETRAMFKGKVFGPLLCEVTVDRPQNAAYLEQHCPRMLSTFSSVIRSLKQCLSEGL